MIAKRCERRNKLGGHMQLLLVDLGQEAEPGFHVSNHAVSQSGGFGKSFIKTDLTSINLDPKRDIFFQALIVVGCDRSPPVITLHLALFTHIFLSMRFGLRKPEITEAMAYHPSHQNCDCSKKCLAQKLSSLF